eukprot:CAMPEP_0171989228 /NCGR_PEP_ID=MMETSP0993-20121228/276307_1 /TAXON_ID=483369 /ORGANISM="non described non described, Strain CCMP2098" /LENGTH=40 /DNA_ID= /DNA_START= /DNA_END= /DNA_ORIENTATION=
MAFSCCQRLSMAKRSAHTTLDDLLYGPISFFYSRKTAHWV